MATKQTGPHVVTANRLTDGAIVWLTAGDRWDAEVSQSAVFEGPALAAALSAAAESERRQVVVAPYEVAVTLSPKGPVPVSRREQIRAVGPSVRPDLLRSSPIAPYLAE
jgi:hypothetical protein